MESIIWSADVTPAELQAVISAGVLPTTVGIKLDQQFFASALSSPLKSKDGQPKKPSELTPSDLGDLLYFYRLIGAIQEAGYPIFLDWKMSEIPSKAVGITQELGFFLPSMLNCMAGSLYTTGIYETNDPKQIDGLRQYADACRDLGIDPCAVTVLTSKDDTKNTGVVFREFRRRAAEQVLFYAKLLVKAGFTDMVCSAQEAMIIRKHPELDQLRLNCPGIRLPDTDVRDQKRTMTPAKALRLGVNRLVIGSNLTDGPEPDIVERVSKNWQRLVAHIESEVISR